MEGLIVGRDQNASAPVGSLETISVWTLLATRSTVMIVAALVSLGLIGWLLTVREVRDMGDMVSGLGQIGTHMPAPVSAPLFLLMWLTMIVAMMLPTVAPVVLAHQSVVRDSAGPRSATAVLVLGYLLVWSAIGLLPLFAFLAIQNIPPDAADATRLRFVAGMALIVAGLYQFTSWKASCQRACRSPIAFVLTHDFGSGVGGALRAGVAQGAYCLGCCWALMSVLVVTGLMNLTWMIALSLVFLAEKNWSRGPQLSRLAGVGVFALGVGVWIVPGLLAQISG